MHYKYLQEKDWKMKVFVWLIMEENQDEFPYEEFGWDGFVICRIYRH